MYFFLKKKSYKGTTMDCMNLSSYNYLGFAENNGKCIDDVEKAIKKYGVATASTRMEAGKKKKINLFFKKILFSKDFILLLQNWKEKLLNLLENLLHLYLEWVMQPIQLLFLLLVVKEHYSLVIV